MPFTFRVLGRVEAIRTGITLPPGPPKQQAVLGALILNANHPVGLDRLKSMLWTDEPPKSAVANLRTYATRLRHVLTDPSEGRKSRLVTGRLSYTLITKPGEVDVDEFDALARKGHEAWKRGDAAGAVRDLSAALALWRGPAGDGVTCGDLLATVFAALEEQRLAVTEVLTDARLALGDHTDIVRDLRTFLARNPMRERSWEQLMLALHRSGRTAEALVAFTEARTVLQDQLGIDPGAQLRELHQRILRRDPDLDPATTQGAPVTVATRPADSAVPRQLPPAVPMLIGRERELEAVRSTLVRPPRRPGEPASVVLHGPAGVGKSALAIEVAHSIVGHFPDGQLYVDSDDMPDQPRELASGLLRALGVRASDVAPTPELATAHLRSLLTELRVLVVVDNVTNAAQLRRLIPPGCRSALLATSRTFMPTLDGVVHIRVERLSRKAAGRLLGSLLGDERVDQEPDALEHIARFCDYLPLAIRIAAARLNNQPTMSLATYAHVLSDERRRLSELRMDDLSIQARLSAGYAELAMSSDPGDAAAASLCALMGRLRMSEVDSRVAATLLQVSEASAQSVLHRLVRANLLEVAAPDRYRMADLVRLFAADQVSPGLVSGPT